MVITSGMKTMVTTTTEWIDKNDGDEYDRVDRQERWRRIRHKSPDSLAEKCQTENLESQVQLLVWAYLINSQLVMQVRINPPVQSDIAKRSTALVLRTNPNWVRGFKSHYHYAGANNHVLTFQVRTR